MAFSVFVDSPSPRRRCWSGRVNRSPNPLRQSGIWLSIAVLPRRNRNHRGSWRDHSVHGVFASQNLSRERLTYPRPHRKAYSSHPRSRIYPAWQRVRAASFSPAVLRRVGLHANARCCSVSVRGCATSADRRCHLVKRMLRNRLHVRVLGLPRIHRLGNLHLGSAA